VTPGEKANTAHPASLNQLIIASRQQPPKVGTSFEVSMDQHISLSLLTHLVLLLFCLSSATQGKNLMLSAPASLTHPMSTLSNAQAHTQAE
jgi:hypothetical protein